MPSSTSAVARSPYKAAMRATVEGGLILSSLPVRNSSGAVTASAFTALAWLKSIAQFMISNMARPDSGTKTAEHLVAHMPGQLLQGMGHRHVAVGLQNLVPVTGLHMHGLGGADLEQGGGRDTPQGGDGANRTSAAAFTRAASICAKSPPME